MPHISVRNLKDKAVYWEINGRDDYGDPFFKAPVEINVRWENINRDIRTPNSGVVGVIAEVFLEIEIPIDSLLWLGELVDVADAQNIVQVVYLERVPSLKRTSNNQRTAYCVKFSKDIPSQYIGT